MTMDDRIRREILARIEDSYLVDADQIDVTVRGGIVYLDGLCAQRELKRMVEYIAECVEGVLGVESRLKAPTPGRAAL